MKRILLSIDAIIMMINLTAQSDLKTKSISIFKNGQSFVIKKGEVKTKDNIYKLTETTNALFGTVWFHSISSKINQIISKLDSITTTKEERAINRSV